MHFRENYSRRVCKSTNKKILALLLQATDDDQPGTDNSRVRYRITQASSGLLSKFEIEPVTGMITLRDKIDYEGLDPALNGRVLIGIEAYDLGSPSRSSSVSVTIQVEVSLTLKAPNRKSI